MSRTKFYKIYKSIKNRCTYSGTDSYKYYGGKGIKYEWKSFDLFKRDMYESYLTHVKEHGEKNTFIERIDNKKNYSKFNCVWATIIEQNRHRSNNTLFTYKGYTKNLVVWAKELGFNKDTLSTRLSRGWTIERMLSTPARKYKEFRI